MTDVRSATTDRELNALWSGRVMAGVRVLLGVLWMTNTGWKSPPTFGEGGGSLYGYTKAAVDHPVFQPYSWVVEHLVLPHFVPFGWVVWIAEIALGAFLIVGLCTRFWAIAGALQSVAIGLSVAQLPGEWPWSYYLMVGAHLALLATAAGRTWGLDELVRPVVRLRTSRVARLVMRAS